MSQTLDHIRQEIKTLRPAERFDLWRDLPQEFDPPAAETSVEAEWDTEIATRLKEIEEDRVELVSADEAIARVRSRLAVRRAGLTPAA